MLVYSEILRRRYAGTTLISMGTGIASLPFLSVVKETGCTNKAVAQQLEMTMQQMNVVALLVLMVSLLGTLYAYSRYDQLARMNTQAGKG